MTLGAPALIVVLVLFAAGVMMVRRVRSRAPGARAHDGGAPARRAVGRWAWRLFRREWHQQLLVLSLIIVAVAATVVGAAVAVDSEVPASNGFGTATDMATFTSAGPQMSSEVAMIRGRYGRTDVIENESRPIPGSVGDYQLRAQRPNGPFGRPMLSLLSGHYPTAPGETALTPSLASNLGLKVGDIWPQGDSERPLRVVGLVQDPRELRGPVRPRGPWPGGHADRGDRALRRAAASRPNKSGRTCKARPALRRATRSLRSSSAGGSRWGCC